MTINGLSPPDKKPETEPARLFDSMFQNTPPLYSPVASPTRSVVSRVVNTKVGGGVKGTVSATAMTKAATDLAEKPEPPAQVMPVALPLEGFVRLASILAPTGPIPVSPSLWWAGIKTGLFPQPLHISKRVTVWRVEDIRKLIASPPGDSGREKVASQGGTA